MFESYENTTLTFSPVSINIGLHQLQPSGTPLHARFVVPVFWMLCSWHYIASFIIVRERFFSQAFTLYASPLPLTLINSKAKTGWRTHRQIYIFIKCCVRPTLTLPTSFVFLYACVVMQIAVCVL